MENVRCTNCGSTAIVTDDGNEFCRCASCGSTFSVKKAAAFSKITLDHTQDVRAWREYLAKQLKLQSESAKARDYSGVKLFAEKILSVLPDDFCALYYVALAERYSDNDTAFTSFLDSASLDGVTADEKKEVSDSLVSTVEPKYLDSIKQFLSRAYPDHPRSFDASLDRNIKAYIQRLRYSKVSERDVFICHRTAAPDQDIADAICTRLEERGLRCWIAPRNILAGSQNYDRDILKGVESCRLFLLVSSFKSIYSEDCETELKAAVLAGKALYSYRIDDTPYDGAFERALSHVQWLDATNDPYEHLEQLVVDIRGILAVDEKEKQALEEKRLAAREKERLENEEARMREQARLDRLERIISGGVAATGPAFNIRSKLKRAEIEIGSGNFDRAENIIDEVLDYDPENGLAWWLMMLCDLKIRSDVELVERGKDYTSNSYYQNAIRFADGTARIRINNVDEQFGTGIVRRVQRTLDEADRLYAAEDYEKMLDALSDCSRLFEDEDSILFKRFPDLVSKFYWLKLWAKYGQSPLVCVEDITRETEYNLAQKYALPSQKAEYDKARDTVMQNARMFLRERSKNRANDSKLSDYLIDNKNILPINTYNYYSSLLYFRRMLDQLNMTEEELAKSTVDISTNEYFMLAQALATEGQKRQYSALTSAIDANRAKKQQACVNCNRTNDSDNTSKPKVLHYAKMFWAYGFAFVSYITFVVALANLTGGDNEAAISCLFASSMFRLGIDIVGVNSIKEKRTVVLTIINMVMTVATFIMVTIGFVAGDGIGVGTSAILFSIATLTIELVVLSKLRKYNGW